MSRQNGATHRRAGRTYLLNLCNHQTIRLTAPTYNIIFDDPQPVITETRQQQIRRQEEETLRKRREEDEFITGKNGEGGWQVVPMFAGLGAARGAPELGEADLEMGGLSGSVHEEQGAELAACCARQESMGVLGGRVCCKALVTCRSSWEETGLR